MGLRGPLPPASPALPGLPPVPPRTYTAWRWLGGQGTGLGAQQAPRAPVSWAVTLCSSPAPSRWSLPPATPDLPASLLCPQDPRGPDGALEVRELAWELSSLPCPGGPGNHPLLLLRSSRTVCPTCLLCGLHFSSPLGPPTSYWFILGFLPSPWGSESPTSGRQAP